MKLLPRIVDFLKSQLKSRKEPVVLRLLVRLRDQDALWQALTVILDPKSPEAERISLLNLFAGSSPGSVQNTAAKLLNQAEPEKLKLAAIAALTQVPERGGEVILLAAYPRLNEREKAAARAALLSRQPWAAVTLAEVTVGKLSAKDFSMDELRLVATHQTEFLNSRVREIWGKVDPPTKEEVLADVRRLNNDLRAFPGDAKNGKVLFTKHCATCHKLSGEGAAVGPDLTFANRTDRDYLLISTVDPSAVVRKEFQSHVALLKNGTVVTGLIVENKPPKMVFVDAKGQKTEVAQSDIDEIRESTTSLMPDNILKQLKPDELRDLFAYLEKP
jgi:putative heme-binding domain-containing protein